MTRLYRFALLAAPLALAGCVGLAGSSRPTTFYLLSSLASGNPGVSAGASAGGVAVGVGPVDVPAHLNRPQIVTRAEDNRLELADFHNWGEPLRANFGRVLAENLSVLLATERVFVYPWARSVPIDYRLRVKVTRFAAGPDASVHLRCRWTLADGTGRTLHTRVSRVDEAAALGDYDAIVAGMSRSLESLAREVAGAVQESAR